MTEANVTFATTSVYEFANGRNSNGVYTALVVATFTTRNGRKISATGWTQETAIRNLARKCPSVA
jgi:hypothetical protein